MSPPKGSGIMRVDKFLKVSRIIKRRTVAKDAADGGKIEINGKVAKAGSTVAVGDIVQISLGQNTIKIRVLELAEHIKKEETSRMFEAVQD